MADGSISLELDARAAALLAQAAKAAGETPSQFATHLVEQALFAQSDAITLESLAEYRRTAETVSVDEGFAELKSRIAARRA
jgi:hypothetical protein